MQTTEEKLTKNLQHGVIKSGQEWIFIERHQMMQLGVDLHKEGNIVGCRIVYVILLINVIHNKSALRKKKT